MSTASHERPPDVYRVDDRSLLLGLYKRALWDPLTARLPVSLHPNVLTIAGQLFVLLAAIASAVGRENRPCLYAVSAACLFTSLTLDNLDGAHARRTNQCSALGELLDHGLDGIASGAVLVITCLVLHLDAVLSSLVCSLGALAFVFVFWEQLRTGRLVLPKISPTEGVTLLAIWQVVAALFGDPTWLRFSVERVTAGTIAVLAFVLVHVVALIAPVVRAANAGARTRELLPVVALILAQITFAFRGAHGLVPAVTVGLIAAAVTCRMISLRHRRDEASIVSPASLRHRRDEASIVSPALYVAAAPALVACFFPRAGSITAWASLSVTIVAVDYTVALARAVHAMARPGVATPPCARGATPIVPAR